MCGPPLNLVRRPIGPPSPKVGLLLPWLSDVCFSKGGQAMATGGGISYASGLTVYILS